MIVLNNFFIISPRGDTVIAKSYRTSDDVGAHERSHTEAFFRKIKFWDGIATPGIADSTGLTPTSVPSAGGEGATGADGGSGGAADGTSGGNGGNSGGGESTDRKGDAPPVFIMPDGLSYIHVKRNGLIFGCSTNRNVSPCTVVEVSSAPHTIKHATSRLGIRDMPNVWSNAHGKHSFLLLPTDTTLLSIPL